MTRITIQVTSTNKAIPETADRLEEIKGEIEYLMDNALQLLRGSKTLVYQRAKEYWYHEVMKAIGAKHFKDDDTLSLADTIEELRKRTD